MKKERSKTSGRQLGQEEGRGCLLSARSKTSGRELGRDGDQGRKSPVRSRDDWKRQDRGGRYQEEHRGPNERRNEKRTAGEEGRPTRRDERERGREPQGGQDLFRRGEIGFSRSEGQRRGHDRKGSHWDMNNSESLERIGFRRARSRSKEVRERRRSLYEEEHWNSPKSPTRVFERKRENKDQYQRKMVNKDLGRGSKERSHKSNGERSFSREDEKSRGGDRRDTEKGESRRSESERKDRRRSCRSDEERRCSSRAALDQKNRAALREEEQERVEMDNTDRIRRERKEDPSALVKQSNNERKLSEVKVPVSSMRKRSAESKSNFEKKRRWSGELSSPKELVEKMPCIMVDNEKELEKETGGDEDVLSKSLPGDTLSVEAETASISKEDVTEQAELASQTEVLKEVTAHTGIQGDVMEPEVAPHTPEEVETEEVTSQATLEMSVEDESVQEEDPFAEERKEVLHELEVVAIEKDAKHALMEKLKSQIRQLEEDLAAGLQEEEELKREEEDLQQRLAQFKEQMKKQ